MDAAAISWTPTSMKKSLIKQDIPLPSLIRLYKVYGRTGTDMTPQ